MRLPRLSSLAFVAIAALAGLVGSLIKEPVTAFAQNVVCYMDQGGAFWHAGSGCSWQVESGGTFNVVAGGAFKINGTSAKSASGQATTATASDTVVTGLTKVTAVSCNLDSSPTTDPEIATCSIGDQNGSPASGSILVQTWKTFGGTPVAATTFSKKVNWVAVGS